MSTVIVCGGRDFADRDHLNLVLDTLNRARQFTVLVHGGAMGADVLADDWARRNDVYIARYPANWKMHGKSAGPIRNGAMLRMEKPSLVVAFAGGAGTADMVRQAQAAGVEVYDAGFRPGAEEEA